MTTPTQGEHAQTEALNAAQILEYWAKYLKGLLGSELLFAAAVLRRLHAQVAALTPAPECLTCNDHGAVGNILTAEPCPDCTPAQPAAPQGVAYAELPEHCFVAFERLYSANQMRDFADRTHALRASNGQAPAGAAQQAPAGVRYVVSAVVIKETSFGFNTQNKLYCVSAASPEEAHGMVLPQLSQDFPEHRLHTLCHWVIEPTTAQAAPAAGAVAGPGWKLVPVKPTDDMLRAIRNQRSGGRVGKGDRADWAAWLAAAPTPAAQADSQPSSFGSHELQAMILARCVEKDKADSVLEDAAQESEYRRGYRHGYEQRDAEVRGALA